MIIKAMTLRRRQQDKLTSMELFLLAAMSKLIATIGMWNFFTNTYVFYEVTYPIIVLKSRLQAKAKDENQRYNGTLDAISRIIKEEGISAFYNGMFYIHSIYFIVDCNSLEMFRNSKQNMAKVRFFIVFEFLT
jgi:hypothetical protein